MNSTKNLKLIIAVLLIALLLSLFLSPFAKEPIPVSKDEICMDYSTDSISTLKNGLIYDMVNLYRENQLQSIQGSVSKPIDDAHTIWFDLDTIKKFIFHIEKNVKSNAETRNSKLGLRIYYAAYPDRDSWESKYPDLADLAGDPITSQYGKRHTLVMLPTILTSDGKIKDINLLNKSTFKNGLTKFENPKENNIMPSEIRNINISAVFPTPSLNATKANLDDQISARNHGSLFPPNGVEDSGY